MTLVEATALAVAMILLGSMLWDAFLQFKMGLGKLLDSERDVMDETVKQERN